MSKEGKSTYRIVFAGGGSGGHTYPLLAVAEAVEQLAVEKQTEVELHYLGPLDQFSEPLREKGIRTHTLLSAKLRRYLSILNILDIPKFFISIIQAMVTMFVIMPDAVFSKGGTGALPVVLAAWFYRIPIIIHESDAIPGLTNALSARFATRIAVNFESCVNRFNPHITYWTGLPMRRSILEHRMSPAEAKTAIGLDPAKPLLLILGGSQGSRRMNEFVIESMMRLIPVAQIFHQTGTGQYEETKEMLEGMLQTVPSRQQAITGYTMVPYITNMETVLCAADLVISRAGSQIFEIAALRKPSILIPHAAGNDHQRQNAREFAEAGAAILLEEENLLPGIVVRDVKTLLENPEHLRAMGERAAGFHKPDAARTIAQELFRLFW